MAVNTQFSIAVHILAGLAYGCETGGGELTSTYIAGSVNTSPSFVRRILSKLSKAGLVNTTTGKSGACRLGREPGRISLLDIYRAVDAPKVFSIHSYEEQKACLVSCHIKAALTQALEKTQKDTESSLATITLGQIIKNVKSPGQPCEPSASGSSQDTRSPKKSAQKTA
jgi:Rrf2 family protein